MKRTLLIVALTGLAACADKDMENRHYGDEAEVAAVHASMETTPVASRDDAADDPAIWVNRNNPAASLILGTDKKAGLGFYDLDGELRHFIDMGRLNNVDLRQGIGVGQWRGDLAAASNRTDYSISLFEVEAGGGRLIGDFPAGPEEPYGTCLGIMDGRVLVFVTYKSGMVRAHRLDDIAGGEVRQQPAGKLRLDSQVEGCVHDDAAGALYIGEEERGLWRASVAPREGGISFGRPGLVDEVNGPTGTTADIEGVALYAGGQHGYVITSSQGNDSYAVYERGGDNRFVGRFRIVADPDSGIDGAQETDGIEASAAALGPEYPAGVLVVQDGANAPRGATQNFKLVDWRDIEAALALPGVANRPSPLSTGENHELP